MQIQIRATEFHIFTMVHNELREAMERHDSRTAYLAMEELRAIEMHSECRRSESVATLRYPNIRFTER